MASTLQFKRLARPILSNNGGTFRTTVRLEKTKEIFFVDAHFDPLLRKPIVHLPNTAFVMDREHATEGMLRNNITESSQRVRLKEIMELSIGVIRAIANSRELTANGEGAAGRKIRESPICRVVLTMRLEAQIEGVWRKPHNKWVSLPTIPAETTYAKYVLLTPEGISNVHYLAWVQENKGIDTHEILDYLFVRQYAEGHLANGGGLLRHHNGMLEISGTSTSFGQPPFDEALDGAYAILNALPAGTIQTLIVEGKKEFELTRG